MDITVLRSDRSQSTESIRLVLRKKQMFETDDMTPSLPHFMSVLSENRSELRYSTRNMPDSASRWVLKHHTATLCQSHHAEHGFWFDRCDFAKRDFDSRFWIKRNAPIDHVHYLSDDHHWFIKSSGFADRNFVFLFADVFFLYNTPFSIFFEFLSGVVYVDNAFCFYRKDTPTFRFVAETRR